MHALLVGGTGMLRGVMEHYRRTCKTVSVLARSAKDLEKLEKRYPGIIRGIPVDYASETALRAALKQSTEKHGRYDLAVVWAEGAPASTIYCIAEYVGTPERKGKLVHVQSIAAADPSVPSRSMGESFIAQTSLVYQEVILGFLKEGSVSRWLDHEEITEGILRAIETGEPKSIVGVVTPWQDRPVTART